MLDAASLFHLFSKLDGRSVARCACVCSSWRAVAETEPLWAIQCQGLEPEHLQRDDVLQALGGYRQYYKWRHPQVHSRVNRICILSGGGAAGEMKVALAEVAQPEGSPGSYLGCNVVFHFPPGAYMGGSVTRPVWSPLGGLLAYSSLQSERILSVVVLDCQGQKVAEEVLDPPSPAFYLHWASCGTRLLLLSAAGGRVVLRAWDVAPALVPGLPAEGRGRLRPRRPVLLGTAQPLFFTCCPTSTRVLWHGDGQHFALSDCATTVDEDGSEHDRFFSNPLPGPTRTPQWVRDAQGREWLLLAVVLPEEPEEGPAAAGPRAPRPKGELVLLPVDALEEAYEAAGSVLSAQLVQMLSTRVMPLCPLGELQDVTAFAANRDGSVVAVAEGTAVRVRFMRAEPERVYDLHVTGPAVGLQWSPDGRKLLLLALGANHGFWLVWHMPPDAPPGDAPVAQLATSRQLGWLMACRRHTPTNLTYVDFIQFTDQVTQSLRLWSPDSDAFCYAAIDPSQRPSLRGIGRDAEYVYVQPVPSLEQLLALPSEAPGGTSGSSGSGTKAPLGIRSPAACMDEQGGLVFLPAYEAPAPSRIMPGSLATWSCT